MSLLRRGALVVCVTRCRSDIEIGRELCVALLLELFLGCSLGCKHLIGGIRDRVRLRDPLFLLALCPSTRWQNQNLIILLSALPRGGVILNAETTGDLNVLR